MLACMLCPSAPAGYLPPFHDLALSPPLSLQEENKKKAEEAAAAGEDGDAGAEEPEIDNDYDEELGAALKDEL